MVCQLFVKLRLAFLWLPRLKMDHERAELYAVTMSEYGRCQWNGMDKFKKYSVRTMVRLW